jgi:hypothetical protein
MTASPTDAETGTANRLPPHHDHRAGDAPEVRHLIRCRPARQRAPTGCTAAAGNPGRRPGQLQRVDTSATRRRS